MVFAFLRLLLEVSISLRNIGEYASANGIEFH